MTRKYTRWIEDSADTLEDTHGAWRFDPFRRVQVWVPGPRPTVANTPGYDPHEHVACTQCGARRDEFCRTTTGRQAPDHITRTSPRECSCGNVIAVGRARRCDDCREQRRQEAKVRRQRARRIRKASEQWVESEQVAA